MEQIEFNLLREPWIRVMRQDCSVQECSLTEVLLDSHKYLRLAGELPTQDVAILRLLLAVLHTVFYRVDPEGDEAPIEERSEAIKRWKELWDLGCFPEKAIREYLETWEDRFWLFHPEYPFYQVPDVEGKGSEFKAFKLNGELSESKNKLRLFPSRAGECKESLSYAEAARWLISIMAFDDSASIKKETGTGVGWLGQHINVYAVGSNLFETLMLNLTFLKDGNKLWEEENLPAWENPASRMAKKKEIAVPENQAALLTLQSRRIILIRADGKVIGHSATGGDFFGEDGSENAFSEQMTQWIARKGTKGQNPIIPMQADANKQMWRDFESIVNESDRHIPGVAAWIRELKKKKVLFKKYVHFTSVGVNYDSNKASLTDIIYDHLDFHASLLDEAGKLWTNIIQKKIMQTQEAAQYLGKLAADIYQAKSGQEYSKAKNAKAANAEIDRVKNQAEQDYYAAVDLPFREWLRSIDPEQGNDQLFRDEKDRQWREEAYKIALRQGESMVRGAGDIAFVGRWIKNGDREDFFSSSKAYNTFLLNLWVCFDFKERIKEAAYE